MNARTKSREFMLQLLFQQEFAPASSLSDNVQFFAKHFNIENSVQIYTAKIVDGLAREAEKIDSVITEASSQWKISRMSFVDKNILRIAIAELMGLTDVNIPPKVAISEAIDMAKKYGSSESSAFTNGILDEAAKLLNIEL